MTGLFNLGSIKHLSLPDTWVSLPVEQDARSGETSYEYRLRSDEDVKLLLFYRGRLLPEPIGQDFLKALQSDPHDLAGEEYFSIECVIRNMSEDSFFQRYSVKTELLNGHKVIAVEGLWKESDLKTLAVFVDGNGKGTLVDELHFYAPSAKYDEHLAEFKKILASIKFVQLERQKS